MVSKTCPKLNANIYFFREFLVKFWSQQLVIFDRQSRSDDTHVDVTPWKALLSSEISLLRSAQNLTRKKASEGPFP